MTRNTIVNANCMTIMPTMTADSIDYLLTDIPYGVVNRESNGLRLLDKGNADTETFVLSDFLDECYRVTKNSLTIFCGKEQFSEIFAFFANKVGTTRPIVWEKSNPSPMNGQYIYLSGVELAVWFKKRGAKTFNAHCKNTVMRHPSGRSKVHPTEKNHKLLAELILDNTNVGDTVFDPCAGSGAHLLVAKTLDRNYFGIELDADWFNVATERLL